MPRRVSDPIRKPLLGFGPAGWVLLAIAIPLAICFFTGYDLRYQLQSLINDTLGPESVRFMTSTVFGVHNLNLIGYWPKQADFGLITMSVMLIAMRIHPRRFGPVPYFAVIAWGLLNPLTHFLLGRLLKWAGLDTGEYMPDAPDIVIRNAISFALTILLFAVVTRSWWLTLLVAAFHTAALIGLHDYGVTMNRTTIRERWIPGSERFVLSLWFMWSWHAATYAGLLFWAIRARLKLPKPGHCLHCNYNLAGITASACPECGRAITLANALAPTSVSPSASTPPPSLSP